MMNIKLLILFLIITLKSTSIEGRLVQKNKTKSGEEEDAQTENPNPSIRLTRNFDADTIKGFTNEDTVKRDEFIQTYSRKARHFLKQKPDHSQASPASKRARVVRDSKDIVKTTKITNAMIKTYEKPQRVLVKKPIPKFTDIYYEDDFQTKMNKARSIIGDSGDHEDQDFNLDDYDFDVNHDEFISGLKHLEPRQRNKNGEGDVSAAVTIKPDVKIQSKVLFAKSHRATKREEPYSKKLDITKEEEYYDDNTSTKAPKRDNKSREADSDYSEDSDDSKENDHKYTRSIRSWDMKAYFNKFDQKSSNIMTKLLGVLPMFPQVPNRKNLDKIAYSIVK